MRQSANQFIYDIVQNFFFLIGIWSANSAFRDPIDNCGAYIPQKIMESLPPIFFFGTIFYQNPDPMVWKPLKNFLSVQHELYYENPYGKWTIWPQNLLIYIWLVLNFKWNFWIFLYRDTTDIFVKNRET